MTALGLDRFGPVALDDLIADAALLTRIDRKYLVPRADVKLVLALLDEDTRVLEIDGARHFAYESVYFDTPDLLSFHMAAHPRRRRFKLRTRAYLDAGSAYLEIKTRGARGTTVKERSEYDITQRGTLVDDVHDDVADAFDAIGVSSHRVEQLAATLTTRYRRTTLLAPDGAARATVDTDLRWEQSDGSGFALPGFAIVESKSPSSASQLDRLLWRAGYRPTTVSKYATGLAALHTELPRNRWARVLRGPFAACLRFSDSRPLTEEPPCAAA